MDSYEALLREIPELGALQATADLALTDPALANATIMRSYHTLSNAFGRLLHGAGKVPENATFITFAGWAAASLRPEVALDDAGFSPASLLRPARSAYHWVARDVLGVDRAISRNIARGQGAIFEDIGSAVYKLLRVVLDALPEFDPDPEVRQRQWRSLWDGYTASLKEMPVYLNPRRNDAEGLDSADLAVLQRAVLPYFEVLMEGLSAPNVDDGARKRRAELILLANVRILAYEQKRLQPLLERNLAYIPDAVRDLVVHRLLHRDRWDARALRHPVTVSHGATALLVEAFQISATRNFYSMVLGTEEVRFGRDLPLPPAADPRLRDRHSQLDRNRYAAGAFFPHHLNNLDLERDVGRVAAARSIGRPGRPHGDEQLAAVRRASQLPRQSVPLPTTADRPLRHADAHSLGASAATGADASAHSDDVVRDRSPWQHHRRRGADRDVPSR